MKAINKIQEEIKRQQKLLKIAKNYQIVLDAWENREALNEKYKFQNAAGEDRLLFDQVYIKAYVTNLFFWNYIQFKSGYVKSFLELYQIINFDVQHPHFKELKKLQDALKVIEWYIKNDEAKFWEVYNLQEM